MSKKFDILNYISWIIVAIFIIALVLIGLTLFFGIPWFVGIVEQLIDKL